MVILSPKIKQKLEVLFYDLRQSIIFYPLLNRITQKLPSS